MKYKLLGLIILTVLLLGTFFLGIKYESHRRTFIDNAKSMNNSGQSINDLKVKALGKGDTISYVNLEIEYLDISTDQFLPIALQMANEHNYPRAYFDVYHTIVSMENLNEESNSLSEWKKLNSNMARLALVYLLNGAKLGNEQSIETLKDYYLTNKKLNPILMNHHDLIIQYSKTIDKIK